MESKIFDRSELEGKTEAQLQQAAQEIKQRFDHKRAFYHHVRNQYFVVDKWDQLNRKVIEFDKDKFTPWNQQWKNYQRSNDAQQVIAFFESVLESYKEMDEFVSTLAPQRSDSQEIESLKKEILQNIESDILSLKTNIATQIDTGINNILGLKAELGLEKNFGENIATELESSKTYRNRFMTSFISAILAIPLFLLSSFYFEFFKNLSQTEIYSLRIGASISLGFLSYFCYSQYKLYQLICLRYSHLSGFLGGGATFISQLIGSENSDVKRDINKKLAELFMELEDIFGLVKKNNHPAEISLDKVSKLLEQVTKLANSNKQS